MSMFDSLLAQAGNVDVAGLAAKVGLDVDQLKTGANAMLARITGNGEAPEQAAAGAAAETGISFASLSALVPTLTSMLGNVDLSSLLSNPSGLKGMLDRDGDGAIFDDLGDMAKGLFGGRG